LTLRPAKVLSTEGDTATIELPGDAVRRAGLKQGEELTAFAPAGPVLILTRGGNTPYFAGSLNTVSAAELSGFLCASVRSGTLVIESSQVRKTVSFRDGQVCHATSTDPGDRLGPILWRNRMLDLQKLRELEPLVKPGTRFGKLLTERGYLTAAQLYRGMQLQVKEIVLGILGLREGSFAFVESDVEASLIKIPERVRDLMLAGIGRADEVASLLRRYPLDAVFEATSAKVTIDPHGQVILALLDGKRMLGEVVMASRLGDYAALKALSVLEPAGAARRITAPVPPPPLAVPARRLPSQGPVEIYERIFDRIADALRAAGRPSAVLNTFFDQLPMDLTPLFQDVRFDEQGRIAVTRVIDNGRNPGDEALGRARALDALDTLVMFAVFELRNALTSDEGLRLKRDVDRLQQGIAP
jgi:hypothetical protein